MLSAGTVLFCSSLRQLFCKIVRRACHSSCPRIVLIPTFDMSLNTSLGHVAAYHLSTEKKFIETYLPFDMLLTATPAGLQTLEIIKTLQCPIVNPTLGGNVKVQDITSASLSPDRKRFIAGGPADQAWPDPWVHVYDYETGQEVECNKGHHGHVWDVAFAPDGETYASGADDGTIRIWKTYPKGRPGEVAKDDGAA